jgi:hypothetical protein
MRFAFWRKPKPVELTEEEKWAIWCPASAHFKVILEPVQKTLYPTDEEHPPFKSTAASQWSTLGGHWSKKGRTKYLHVTKDHTGMVTGVKLEVGLLKEQVDHWKWMAKHPRLVRVQAEQIIRHRETLLDSALFL